MVWGFNLLRNTFRKHLSGAGDVRVPSPCVLTIVVVGTAAHHRQRVERVAETASSWWPRTRLRRKWSEWKCAQVTYRSTLPRKICRNYSVVVSGRIYNNRHCVARRAWPPSIALLLDAAGSGRRVVGLVWCSARLDLFDSLSDRRIHLTEAIYL